MGAHPSSSGGFHKDRGGRSMIDKIRAKNISLHIGRAAQHEIEGDCRQELRSLLFASQDIADVLHAVTISGTPDARPCEWMSATTAKGYTRLLKHIAARIDEIIDDKRS